MEFVRQGGRFDSRNGLKNTVYESLGEEGGGLYNL